MKSKEELNAIKEEVKTLNQKLAELTDEEMMQVVGGALDEQTHRNISYWDIKSPALAYADIKNPRPAMHVNVNPQNSL